MIELMSSMNVSRSGNDLLRARWYCGRMATPRHDWYLKQWLKTLGKTQQWVADELELQKSKISRKASGTTAYDRDDINAIAALLHLQPYELLMHPEEAMEIRSLRKSIRLAAERRAAYHPQPEEKWDWNDDPRERKNG